MAEGLETWEKVIPSVVWVVQVDSRGNVRPRRLAGPAGRTFQIKKSDRETAMDRAARNAFNNGSLKAKKGVAEEVKKEVEDENTLTEDELASLVRDKTGMAFISALSKLNEMNVYRLKALTEEGPDGQEPKVDASAAQLRRINERVEEFRSKRSGPTSGYKDLTGETTVTQ